MSKFKTEWRAACPRTDGRMGRVANFEWVKFDTKEECEKHIENGLHADKHGTWSEREKQTLYVINPMTSAPVIQSRQVSEWEDNEQEEQEGH